MKNKKIAKEPLAQCRVSTLEIANQRNGNYCPGTLPALLKYAKKYKEFTIPAKQVGASREPEILPNNEMCRWQHNTENFTWSSLKKSWLVLRVWPKPIASSFKSRSVLYCPKTKPLILDARKPEMQVEGFLPVVSDEVGFSPV